MFHSLASQGPTVLREHEKIARQCAAENVDHVRYLARLIELELLDREARMIDRRIKAAKFPAIKSPTSRACRHTLLWLPPGMQEVSDCLGG